MLVLWLLLLEDQLCCHCQIRPICLYPCSYAPFHVVYLLFLERRMEVKCWHRLFSGWWTASVWRAAASFTLKETLSNWPYLWGMYRYPEEKKYLVSKCSIHKAREKEMHDCRAIKSSSAKPPKVTFVWSSSQIGINPEGCQGCVPF